MNLTRNLGELPLRAHQDDQDLPVYTVAALEHPLVASALEEPPSWEYLLSHHSPSRYSRTLSVRIRTRYLRLCARCTGQVLGGVAWFAVLLFCQRLHLSLFSAEAQWPLALFPTSAAWDWVSQSVGPRESANILRLISGALVGFALADLAGALVTAHWVVLTVGVLVLVTYVVVILVALRATGAWRHVLEEHFPGLDLRQTD